VTDVKLTWKSGGDIIVEKVITQCPHCQSKFKLGSDKLGKKIKCPKCKGIFVVEELKRKPKVASKPAAAPQPAASEAAPQQPEAAPASPAAEEPKRVPLQERRRPLTVRDFMETQSDRFMPEKAQGVDAHISYTFAEKGKEPEQWNLKIQNGTCEVTEGPDPTAKSHVKMKAETYLKMATDQLDGRVAFMLGKLKIKGDKTSLATVRECFAKTGLKDWK